jgi:hypothetical protein
MYVHLFNWPVSPSYIGWAALGKITAFRGALIYLRNYGELKYEPY